MEGVAPKGMNQSLKRLEVRSVRQEAKTWDYIAKGNVFLALATQRFLTLKGLIASMTFQLANQ